MLDQFEVFVRTVLGNHYSINFKKLFARATTAKKLEQRQFFCSELVAKAFKEMGLLKTAKASSTFYPSSFSIKNKLQLEGGA